MPEYSSTTITPSDGVQVPGMNGSTSGNLLLSALRDFILASKGQANGLASLGSDGKLTASQLPDLADDVIVVASYATLPAIGTAGKIYITADNNKMYRWDSDLATPDYVELSVDLSAYATKAELAAEESARESEDSNLKSAIQGNAQRIENLEVAVSGSLVQTNTDATMANTKTITNANEILPWAILKRVGARAVAWNQIVGNGNFETTNAWYGYRGTLSAQNNELTFTVVADSGGASNANAYRNISKINGHVYIIIADFKVSRTGRYYVRFGNTNRAIDLTADTYKRYAEVISSDETISNAVITTPYNDAVQDGDKIYAKNYQIFDLTAMNMASLTASQFRSLFPASYYPQDTGHIYGLNPSAFKVVGKNKIKDADLIRVSDEGYSTNTWCQWTTHIPYIEGASYTFSCKGVPITGGWYFGVRLFTKSGEKIISIRMKEHGTVNLSDKVTFTISGYPNADYFIIMIYDATLSSYTPYEAQCEIGTTKSDFTPYSETTIDTSFTEDYLYVNENCHDYSENVLVNGVMRRKDVDVDIREVNLGQLDWYIHTGGFLTSNGINSVIKKPANNSILANISTPIYNTITADALYGRTIDKAIACPQTGAVWINDTNITSADIDANHKVAKLNGVILRFESINPTFTLHDPIPNIPCEDGTTVTAVTPQTDLVNAIDVPSTIAYMTKIGG